MIKFIFILLFIPSITFAATLKEKYTNLPTPILVKEGKKLYQENGCALCHGDKGKGCELKEILDIALPDRKQVLDTDAVLAV